MQVTVSQERDNPLFKRKDLVLTLRHDSSSTPSKSELVKSLAQERGVDESQVVVEYVSTSKGVSESTAKVKILNEKPPAPAAPRQEEKKDAAEGEAKEEKAE